MLKGDILRIGLDVGLGSTRGSTRIRFTWRPAATGNGNRLGRTEEEEATGINR